jgi:hypothetical protein
MTPYLQTSPRIAMMNVAVQLLPHFAERPLRELETNDRSEVLRSAVFAARELMKFCSYDRDDLCIADFRDSVAAATEISSQSSKPEWIRLPTKGRCAYTGLSRSTLYTLIAPCEANGHRPPVRSVSLRRRGNTKGVRLIYLQSLLDYLEANAPAPSTQ